MKDIYDVNQIQKEAETKRTEQEDADKQILEEAEKIEEMNYQKAKQARMNLEAAADKQKQTTQTMRGQGEKINTAKSSAARTNKNARAANDLAVELHENRNAWGLRCGCLTGLKKWCSREGGEEDATKGLAIKASQDEVEEFSSEVSQVEGDEYVKGQNKTDQELKGILHGLKKINSEADTQEKLANQQKTDLEAISKANEYTKRQVEKTDKRLNKDLE